MEIFDGVDSEITYCEALLGCIPLRGRMSDTVIRRAARALNPDRPIRALAALGRCPRSTAKSWATLHRRPPVSVLKVLREAINARQSAIFAVLSDLDLLIMKREYEPKHRTGFNLIRERDGPGSIPRDGRNRHGRPRKRFG